MKVEEMILFPWAIRGTIISRNMGIGKYLLAAIMIFSLPLTAWGGCPDGMKPVPGGKFKMGFRDRTEKTGSFCMDINMVTVAEYKKFQPDFQPHELSPDDDNPVTFITLKEARRYCESQGKRLPNEREWEKACRGPKGWKYPYGNEFDGEKCHTNKVATEGTVGVGSHSGCVSGYGMFDMAGNAMEWTITPHGRQKNLNIIKGSAWPHSMTTSRCSHRFKSNPREKFSNTGFRCVK